MFPIQDIQVVHEISRPVSAAVSVPYLPDLIKHKIEEQFTEKFGNRVHEIVQDESGKYVVIFLEQGEEFTMKTDVKVTPHTEMIGTPPDIDVMFREPVSSSK